eukprot:3149235-Prymnesium_polylepis.3
MSEGPVEAAFTVYTDFENYGPPTPHPRAHRHPPSAAPPAVRCAARRHRMPVAYPSAARARVATKAARRPSQRAESTRTRAVTSRAATRFASSAGASTTAPSTGKWPTAGTRSGARKATSASSVASTSVVSSRR